LFRTVAWVFQELTSVEGDAASSQRSLKDGKTANEPAGKAKGAGKNKGKGAGKAGDSEPPAKKAKSKYDEDMGKIKKVMDSFKSTITQALGSVLERG
jgi:hypothetical protein